MRAVAAQRNVQQQVAVLADDVDEHLDDGVGGLVPVLLEGGPPVVPVADAGVGLPRLRQDPVGASALDVEHHRPDVIRLQPLRRQHGLEPSVRADVGVVEVRGDVEAGLAERQLGVVEVEKVRLVLVDQVLAAQEPAFDEVRIVGRRLFGPLAIVLGVPGVRVLDRRECRRA